MRTEQEIFANLASLCASPGYAHVIAYFCYRDNFVGYDGELKGENLSKLFSKDRLIRTEISTLIGLMARAPINYTLPSQQEFGIQIERTEALLSELHEILDQPMTVGMQAAIADKKTIPPWTAEAMREPIFYGGESAYNFQYRDLAPKKYARDEEWLRQNVGFSIEDAKQVLVAISSFQKGKLLAVVRGLKDLAEESRSVLEGFQFAASDIVATTQLPSELVDRVLSRFTFPDDGNPTFLALHEFNSTNA